MAESGRTVCMRFFVLALIILPFVQVARAQGSTPASPASDHGWFTVGYGRGAPDELGVSATVNLGRTRNVQLGYHAVGFFSNMHAINIGVGRSVVGRIGRLAAAAGPAVVWWDGADPFTTVGAVASIQVILTPIKEIGLGLEFWGNLNSERSVGGVSLMLVLEGNK